MLSLTPYRPGDSAQARFIFEVRTAEKVVSQLLKPPPKNLGQHLQWLKENVDHESRFLYLIERNGEPIGYAQAYNFTSDHSCELGWALHPDFHGQGLGDEAVWAWLSFCDRFNVKFYTVTVKRGNERALNLYDKYGFIAANPEGDVIRLVKENKMNYARLTYLGHAGFVLSYRDIRLLVDPWFNPAFYESWAPRPSNAHLRSLMKDPTHVYISHSHEDHFDERYLRTLPPSTEFIVPWFMARKIRDLGFENIKAMQDDYQYVLDEGFNFHMFLDEKKKDSACLIHVAGQKILNLNDCHLPLEKLPKADVLLCQFSGAFHYPHCYDFPPDVQATKVGEVKSRYVNGLIERAKATGAKVYIPSSGPPALSNPWLTRGDSIFYGWDEVSDSFKVCDVENLMPGDALLLGEKTARVDLPIWFARRLQIHRARELLIPYFVQLAKKHEEFLKVRPKAFGLIVGDAKILVAMGPASKSDVNYTICVPPEMMVDLTRGGRWDAAFLSNRIKLHRDRDVYDHELFQLLYNDRPEDPALALPSPEPEMVHRGDGVYHQRFCPHQGHDLTFAPMAVRDDKLLVECPRHGWQWDVKTGKCLKGGDCSLKTEVPT